MSAAGPAAHAALPPSWGSHQPWSTQHNKSVLLPVLGLVAMAVPGLLVLGIVSTDIGASAVIVGAFAAVVPVVVVVAAILWVDRWEPEPSPMLLTAFVWGASVAVFAASFVNDSAYVLGELVLGAGGGLLVGPVISAPIAEEAFKGLFLLGLLWFRRREFDGLVDGIVYAGLVAAGFAFTENILYFGRAFASDGLAGEGGGVLAVFLIRGLLSPFAHPLFTSLIGLAVGIAAGSSRSTGTKAMVLGVGYLGAVVLHALWNASAGYGLLLVVYPLIMVPLFGCLVALVVWQRHREQRVVAAQLPGFAAAGWIAPSEVGLLASMAGRRDWRAAVRRRAGDEAAAAVRDYQTAVTELAFLRHRMERGTVGSEAGRWHHQVLGALMAARARAVNAPNALGSAWRLPPPPGWSAPPSVLPPTAAGEFVLPHPPGQPGRYLTFPQQPGG
ncbi:MAG TPA: PrsW family intramembrane metalloprotease [Pseudonocardiaceae bacterium]|jgi:RsiW-degrading membrane proteinase PrsW (M82 family)|nr:PrsW family intramembrane metalloprotease [Pseudonocardiaceae bacterium]